MLGIVFGLQPRPRPALPKSQRAPIGAGNDDEHIRLCAILVDHAFEVQPAIRREPEARPTTTFAAGLALDRFAHGSILLGLGHQDRSRESAARLIHRVAQPVEALPEQYFIALDSFE
jgi:hypothetical protein